MNVLLFLLKVLMIFAATEIDDFIVFVILYSRNSGRKQKTVIFLAQVLVLITVTLLCGFIAGLLSKIPEKYIRLIGLLPLLTGIAELIKFVYKKSKGKTEAEDNSRVEKTENRYFKLFLLSASVVIAASGDNLGIYIPFFVNMTVLFKLLSLALFVILQCGLSFLQIKASEIPVIQKIVSKTGVILEPVVFILLGICILAGI